MSTPKRFCFAIALLPYGAIEKANAHCTHLQITRAYTQTKICKRVQFLPTLNRSFINYLLLIGLLLLANNKMFTSRILFDVFEKGNFQK
jgi:hypothetical protein